MKFSCYLLKRKCNVASFLLLLLVYYLNGNAYVEFRTFKIANVFLRKCINYLIFFPGFINIPISGIYVLMKRTY